MKLAVYGQGHLGAPLADVFHASGYDVVGIDPKIRRNKAPDKISGPTLSDQPEAANISFIVVPTPSLLDGSFNDYHVDQALWSINHINTPGHIAVIVSTVSPGTCEELAKKYPLLRIVYNPTFVAIGNVTQGLVDPDLLLIGGPDDDAVGQVRLTWSTVYRDYNRAPHLHLGSYIEIELLKLSLNCLLGMKISAANSLGQLFEAYGVDPAAVAVLGYDHRISGWGLTPGTPIGGPCLPRDNRALRHSAKLVDLDLPISRATDLVNQEMYERMLVRILIEEPKSVGVLGLSYKYGTDVTDGAVGTWLTHHESLAKDWLFYDSILPCDDLNKVLACELIVVTQREYRSLVPAGKNVVDLWS